MRPQVGEHCVKDTKEEDQREVGGTAVRKTFDNRHNFLLYTRSACTVRAQIVLVKTGEDAGINLTFANNPEEGDTVGVNFLVRDS